MFGPKDERLLFVGEDKEVFMLLVVLKVFGFVGLELFLVGGLEKRLEWGVLCLRVGLEV